MKDKGNMYAALKYKIHDWENHRPLKDQLTIREMLIYFLEPSSSSPTLAIDSSEYHDIFWVCTKISVKYF